MFVVVPQAIMNWYIVSCLMLLALFQDGTTTPLEEKLQNSDAFQKFNSDWSVGDPRRCQEQFRHSKFDVKRFEVMPGIGWDNLRNVEAGLVAVFNYSKCKVTDDGRLLIPDSVFTVPIKSSSGETFAELYDHWLNTSSITSHTINIQAGLALPSKSVSGQFSYENEKVKSKQIEDKAVTTRIQVRYSRYEAKLQPDAELTPEFKKRLLHIAANIELNYTEQAMYEGQLLVRDFGTHVLTSVTAGAALVKDDYLKRQYVLDHADQKTAILASASASFKSVFKISASYGHKTGTTQDDMYEKIMTHSFINSHGGPLYKAGNMSLDEWTNGVDENLVPINRAGDPLYFLITPTLLPELPYTTVAEVEKIVRQSVELYYEMNTIRGCTKLGSPNFSFSANFDDGSCNSKPTNLTFGGVYQQCATRGQFVHHDPCTGLNVVNPKTGSYSCPASYKAIELQSGRKNAQNEGRKDCHRCWLFFQCCHTKQFYSEAMYSTYWCAATGRVEKESGYLFGGLYTSTTENVVTGAKGCPANFYARKMFTDLNICISDNYEFGEAFSVPFGGFFSCKSGNPLAADSVHPMGSKQTANSNSLRSFMAQNGNSWPMKCPEGYSQHIATDDMGCSIHYCVQTGALISPALPPVKRPPFMNKPAAMLEQNDNVVMFNVETGTWMKNENAMNYQGTTTSKQGNSSGKEMSPGVIAAISVVATLGFIGFAAVMIVVVRRRRLRQRRSCEPQTNYGLTTPANAVINEAA